MQFVYMYIIYLAYSLSISEMVSTPPDNVVKNARQRTTLEPSAKTRFIRPIEKL